MLGLQYLLVYGSQDGGSTLVFGVLTYMRIWLPIWRIPIQLLLSLAFPLAVSLCAVLRAGAPLPLSEFVLVDLRHFLGGRLLAV